MKSRFGKTQIFGALVIVVAAATWLYFRHGQIQDGVIERNKSASAGQIQSRAAALINPADMVPRFTTAPADRSLTSEHVS